MGSRRLKQKPGLCDVCRTGQGRYGTTVCADGWGILRSPTYSSVWYSKACAAPTNTLGKAGVLGHRFMQVI